MTKLLSWYSYRLPIYLVYMLQQVEYNAKSFLVWILRLHRSSRLVSTVMYRKKLEYTIKAQLLVASTYILIAASFLIILIVGALFGFTVKTCGLALLVVVFTPVTAVAYLSIVSFCAWLFVVNPSQRRQVAGSTQIFREFKGITIGIAGSYGKTTMKEILTTVLSQRFDVAVTPGNMNTPVAHARFAGTLENQDVAIIEYGEGAPGDIERFARTTQPDYAVITGVAPNHLDRYKTLTTLTSDLLSLRSSVEPSKLYINGDSLILKEQAHSDEGLYSADTVAEWNISQISVSTSGTSFVMKNKSKRINVESGLLGRHQVAPLALAVVLGIRLGLSINQVELGTRKVVPIEHRMSTYMLSGALIIDDTYNGNLEGITVGLNLLKTVSAKRKLYVTPGLVEQGEETERVHIEIAKLINNVKPDILVLINNSATRIIDTELTRLDYDGQIMKIDEPLQFYTNIGHIVARGDVVLLQNDWTDNYN